MNVRDEGYIKFRSILNKGAPPAESELADMILWREKLYDLGLIGAYSDGIGFGNISIRADENSSFVITGSATGNIPRLAPEHFTRVLEYSITENWVNCEGQIDASSESMTHAAVYECEPSARAVIHIHSMKHWKNLLNRIPTSDPRAKYGTPEMAEEIKRLFKETPFSRTKVMAMGGHEEGILSFGSTLDEAGTLLLSVIDSGV